VYYWDKRHPLIPHWMTVQGTDLTVSKTQSIAIADEYRAKLEAMDVHIQEAMELTEVFEQREEQAQQAAALQRAASAQAALHTRTDSIQRALEEEGLPSLQDLEETYGKDAVLKASHGFLRVRVTAPVKLGGAVDGLRQLTKQETLKQKAQREQIEAEQWRQARLVEAKKQLDLERAKQEQLRQARIEQDAQARLAYQSFFPTNLPGLPGELLPVAKTTSQWKCSCSVCTNAASGACGYLCCKLHCPKALRLAGAMCRRH
jgi:hypothetical protein